MSEPTGPWYTKQLVVVTCEESSFEGLYVDGKLVSQDDTIYASQIAVHTEQGPIQFTHHTVVMPVDVTSYPESYEDCRKWIPKTPGVRKEIANDRPTGTTESTG